MSDELASEPPQDFPRLISRERAALLDVLRSIGIDDWSAPSPCPGWTVHDLALHILGTDIGVLSRQRDNHFGSPPPSGTTDAASAIFLDRLNQKWVEAMRRTSPAMVINLLRRTGEELVEFYLSTDSSVRDAIVSWASTDPVPRWFDHARELTERWVHHQQILESVGASDWMDPEMTAAVLDTFSHAYPLQLSRIRRPEGTTAGVDVTGIVRRSWRWVSTGSGWQRVGGDSSAESLLTMSTPIAWKLLTNGVPASRWPEPSPAIDAAVARVLVRTRAVLGAPNG